MSKIAKLLSSRYKKKLHMLFLIRSYRCTTRTSLHPALALANGRMYGTSQSDHLLNKIRDGNISKTDVIKLIINQEHMKAHINNLETKNHTISSHGVNANDYYNTSSIYNNNNSHSKISMETMGKGSSLNYEQGLSSISTIKLGSKHNPLYMRKQTSWKEFVISLFPFLFIFWIFGGFDLVKNRKNGVNGNLFGKNYSEWDETNWVDDDDDNNNDKKNNNEEKIESETEEQIIKRTAAQAKKNRLLNINNDDKSNDDNKSIENSRRDFFKKLGIDLTRKSNNNNKQKNGSGSDSSNNDENKQNNNENNNEISTYTEEVIVNSQKDKKKQKRIRFKDVCGNDEAKIELQDLVDYLKHPEKYQKMGCKLPKGVLMAGAPGTGKTLLARAVAGEAGVPFLATNGASFDEIFVGVGVTRVRKLFERAKELAPCIVFIDEIDSIANTRMQMGTAHSSDSLNALLSEMDGFEQNTGIIIMGATNMADRLDPALIRPGRFDRKIQIQLPDKKARIDIVKLYLKDRASNDVNLDLLVGDIAGFSGAELESMVNIASIECVKQNCDKIFMHHLIEAKEIISMGRARKTLQLDMNTKRVTAFHESGHAIVSLYTKGSKPIYKATILPRGPALGFVASTNEDEFMSTKEALLAQLDTCMGGRAAEEIFNGTSQITTGASSDFNQATRIATAMVCQYGMSPKVGKIFYRIEDVPKLSSELQNLINSEVKRLLDESFQRSKQLILDHRQELETLALVLLEKETLSGTEIKQVVKFDQNKVRDPKDPDHDNNHHYVSSPKSSSSSNNNNSKIKQPSILTPQKGLTNSY